MQCGCKCISCGVVANGTTLSGDACPTPSSFYKKDLDNDPEPPFVCNTRDSSTCGFQYSSVDQIAWCPVESPSLFPPLYPVRTGGDGCER